MKVRLLSAPTWEDWLLVKKAAFRTIGKDAKIEPKMEWRRKMLKAVHSPIRLLNYTVLLEGVPSWVSVHLVRHVHAQPFVTTQRNDRMDRDETYDRRKAPQDTPIDMIWSFNAEELMTICHKRLCMLASKETREWVQEVVRVITRECPEWQGTDLLVPLCTYRGGLCSEFMPCEYYLEHGHGFMSPRLTVSGTEPSYDEVVAWVRKKCKDISHEEFMNLSAEMRKARELEDTLDPKVISTWEKTSSHYTVNPDGSIECTGPIKER